VFMRYKICSHCKTRKALVAFEKRIDRIGTYAWCKICMSREGRSTDYPKIEHRGSGNANPDKDWQIGP